MSKTDDQKREHISYLMKRRTDTSPDNKPQFVQLIHRIRTLCIIRAYFPNDSQYDSQIGDILSHPGWDDFMTIPEKNLLNEFYKALIAIETRRDVTKFDIVDKKFGNYRYSKWLNSQK